MTKKKYRQQSDTTPLSESASSSSSSSSFSSSSSSSSSVPVSHSDDEGNVVIDTTTDAPATNYEPIPEVVELESSSVQDPGPVAESPESSEIGLVSVPMPEIALLEPALELALERVLEPVPALAPECVLEPVPVPVLASEPIAPSQALVADADPNADAVGVSEPLSVRVLDSSSSSTTNTTSTPTPNTTSKWIQFKSWFSKCCRACCCCCCCCHRHRSRHSK